jgi:tRNA(Ile2) C34 agmatinyltransferase TiaS
MDLMPRPKIKFPYCRMCLKTRDNSSDWQKIRIDSNGKKHERKNPACGICGHVLSWRIRKTQHKIKRTSVPDNVKQNLMTKSDIKNNLDFWKHLTRKLQRKP